MRVNTATVRVYFPASLNFIIYARDIGIMLSGSTDSGPDHVDKAWRASANLKHWPNEEDNHLVAATWAEQLENASQDGLCLAEPTLHFRSLFAATDEGEREFYMAWKCFYEWWSTARTAYEYAVQPFVHPVADRYIRQNKSVTILVIYRGPPPGCSLQTPGIQVVPFEKLVVEKSIRFV